MVNVKLIAAAVSAAAALTGCSQTDAPAPTPAAEPAPSQWVDAGDRQWRDDLAGQEIAAGNTQDGTLRSGSALLQPRADDPTRAALCAAGAWFNDPNSRPVLLSAGHCDKTPSAAVAISPRPGAGLDELITVGAYANTYPDGSPFLDDVAVLRLDPGIVPATDSAMVAGRWPADGVLNATGARRLNPGTSVCVVGVPPGVRCGGLMVATDSSVMVDMPGASLRGGDSGAAAWLIDTAGKAVLLGGVTGGSVNDLGTTLTVDLADPIVRGLDLNLVEGEQV